MPNLDRAALAKAQFVEYSWKEPPGKYPVWPWPHQVDFDPDGNVWLAYTSCCIVRFDPRTAQSTAYEGNGGGHGIAVDQSDGTVWYSGDAVRRLDPKTGLVDRYKVGEDAALGSNTQIFDSKGNLWLSFLAAGALGKWDRASDTIQWWDVPVVASRPYGIIVDNQDKVWWADYHNGGVSRFDPVTGRFRFYRLVREHSASSIRRLGVDSKNHIWAGTWSSLRGVAKLYRLDPETDEVMERTITDLPYAAVYSAEADSQDNIWLSNDNYLSVYDPRADRFTHFPIPVRSDTLKTTITRDDTVWFFYRNAGKYANYGANAVAFFRDKDRIESLGAYHSKGSVHNRMHDFRGPAAPKVHRRAASARPRRRRMPPRTPPGRATTGSAAPPPRAPAAAESPAHCARRPSPRAGPRAVAPLRPAPRRRHARRRRTRVRDGLRQLPHPRARRAARRRPEPLGHRGREGRQPARTSPTPARSPPRVSPGQPENLARFASAPQKARTRHADGLGRRRWARPSGARWSPSSPARSLGRAGVRRFFNPQRRRERARMTPHSKPTGRFSALQVGVVWRRFSALMDETAQTFVRTSFSSVVRDNWDLAVSVMDGQGRLFAQSSRSVPSFIGTMPRTLEAMLQRYPRATLNPGDVLISNDGHLGTGHLNDITMIRPVFRGTRLVAFVGSIFHSVDIGGAPSIDARDSYAEGLTIPIAKIVRAGVENEDVVGVPRRRTCARPRRPSATSVRSSPPMASASRGC